MKVLILVSCVLAVASAGSPYFYGHYAQHVPVIGHDGVPLETPEVQAAKAHHFAAHAEANARSGHYGVVAPLSYGAYGAVPVVHSNALPLDTPEVAAAKVQHYHDYAVAAQRNGVHVAHVAPILSGHPVDTPEVQLAKAAHFAAHAAARGHGLVHYRKRRGIYAYAQHIPVIGHNGVPVETPEVQAAKAHHFAAHAEASARSGAGHYYGASPVYYSAYSHHVPAIGANGVPLDTPEVEAAKAHHFAAHAEAATRSGHYAPLAYAGPYSYGAAVLGHDGAPVETPEVQLAKAAHFAAHAAARSGHY